MKKCAKLGNPHNGRYSVSFMWLPSVLKVKNLHKANLQSRGQFTFLMVFMNATLLLCLNPRWLEMTKKSSCGKKYSTHSIDVMPVFDTPQLLQLIKANMLNILEEHFPLSFIYIPSSMYTHLTPTHPTFSSIELSANSLIRSTFLRLFFYYPCRMLLYPSLVFDTFYIYFT
jgi:hypothetical protein